MNIEIRHRGRGHVLFSAEGQSLKEALAAAAEKARSVRNYLDAGFHVSYQPVILEEADLRGIDLSGITLHDVSFRGADLRGADLRSITLYDGNLSEADLSGADLRGAALWRTILNGANLEGADLRGATLRGCELEDTRLRGAKLEGISLSRTERGYTSMAGEDFIACGINWASRPLISELLRQAADGGREKLEAIGLIPVKPAPQDDEISWEKWKATDHPLKDWVGNALASCAAKLHSKPPKAIAAFLPPTRRTSKKQPAETSAPRKIEIRHRLDGAVLFSAEAPSLKEAVTVAVGKATAARKYSDEGEFLGGSYTTAYWGGADLRGEDLSGADLGAADLSDADLSGANLRGAWLFITNLTGAELEGADLRETDLTYTNLHGADLTGANFAGCQINWASLPLISELLRQAAGDDREKLEAIRQLSTQPAPDDDEIVWSEWETADHPLNDWVWDTLALQVVEGDGSPEWLKERPTYEVRPAPVYRGLA